jgi:hypothetical protein
MIVQAIKLLIMQFSPTSCHFISLRSKYCPQQFLFCVLSLTAEARNWEIYGNKIKSDLGAPIWVNEADEKYCFVLL